MGRLLFQTLRPSSRVTAWLPVLGLFALGATVRALRFWGGFVSWAHWDETRLAIPAIWILGGNFPIHHLGVEYQGATPSYPLAVWFALFGTSVVSLDLFAYGVGLVILWTGYLVARRLLEPAAARWTLAVLAMPPLLLSRWSLSGNLNYPFLLVLGHLVLLVTHTLFFRSRGHPRSILTLGLLVGIGWWTNPLTIVYLAPFGLLVIRTGLLRRARVWLFSLGVLLGGSPAWLYELWYFPSARFALHEAGSGRVETLRERVTMLTGEILPDLLGVPLQKIRLSAVGILWLLVLLLGAVAVIQAVARDRDELRWAFGLGGQPAAGGSLLWGVLVTNVALVLFTKRPLGHFYLLPLYSVLLCWIGETLCWLWRRRRILGGTALAMFVGFQLWANWTDPLSHTKGPRWISLQASINPLVRWLETHGIRQIYWAGFPDLPSYEFTYLTEMRVVAADLWAEPAVPDSHLVDAAVNPPLVTREGDADLQEPLHETLRGIGMQVRERRVAGFNVIETTPAFTTGFTPLAPDGWIVTASHNPQDARNLIDRDASTRWTTGLPKAPGQWLAVDLGAEEVVARVDLLAIDWKDVPAGFRVGVSRDGIRWKEVVSVPRYTGPLFFSEYHPFLKIRRGRVQAVFPPVRARFLRIIQTGTDPTYYWSAREIFIYRPGPPHPPLPRPGEITAALRREGVHFVYANHWLSAMVQVESAETIGAQESNSDINSYGRDVPPPEQLGRFRLAPGSAILLGSDGDVEEIRRMLAGQPVAVRDATAGPYHLLVFSRAATSPRRLPKDGWWGTASENPDQARLAIDGESRTSWTSTNPVGPGMSFTLDLGMVHQIDRIRIRPGSRGGLGDLGLQGSTDGEQWFPLEPVRWAGRLYWAGSELLKNSQNEFEFAFPPAKIRYLRFTPRVKQERVWLLQEIDVFE